jgi:phosphoribosyl 1,2-cyclic phosphodiesterase
MIIRCYGARGSIGVSGERYVKYGGDTTCLEIRTRNDEIIIVDAGSGIRRLGNRLLCEERFEYNLIFTHSHMDHISVFPFFKPVYDGRTTLHLLGCPTTQGNLKKLLSKAMHAPFFPYPFDNLKAKIQYTDDCALSFRIDSVEILPINLSHPNGGMGYKFLEAGKAFVFLTDNELGYRHRNGRSFQEYVEFAKGADLLVHDAEYTPEQYRTTRTWGHSTYSDALNLALSAKAKRFGLFHHNQDRFDAEMDGIVRECREVIERQGVDTDCFALTQTTELTL